MEFIDEISPRHYGEDRLRLTLTDPDQVLRAFLPVLVTVDYSPALPEGVVLPLEFTVTAPSEVNSTRMVFRRFPPNELAFTPREGGVHLVRVAELWHNLYWGKLEIEIDGDRARGT